jgi:Flp pilus assembly protein TadG
VGIRRRSFDRGATAVEAALVLPVLLLVVFGIIDFGRLLNAQLNVTTAAREGARALAVGGSPSDAHDRIMVILGDTGWTATTTTCPSNPGTFSDAKVVLSDTFEFVTPLTALAGIGDPSPLTATAVMPCRG